MGKQDYLSPTNRQLCIPHASLDNKEHLKSKEYCEIKFPVDSLLGKKCGPFRAPVLAVIVWLYVDLSLTIGQTC